MSYNVTKAISSALDQHAATEKHINRWTDALTATIYNGIVTHLSERLYVSEELRIRAATMANSLAVDFVDDILPKQIEKIARGAKVERTAFASALTQKFMAETAELMIGAATRALNPQIEKRLAAQDRRFASQPSGDYVEPKIDLGAMARSAQERFALEDARKAAPVAPQPVAFIEDDPQAAAERTLAQNYSATERGPAPSAARVAETLAKADTAIDLAPGGGKYPAKRRR